MSRNEIVLRLAFVVAAVLMTVGIGLGLGLPAGLFVAGVFTAVLAAYMLIGEGDTGATD